MKKRSRRTPKRDVLLVDDDPSMLAILGLALRREGLGVVACSTAEEALSELARMPFRWLVTDGQMAPRDGFTLAAEAKRLAPDIRIVMISALYTESDIQGRPIDRLFSKPIPVDTLVALLRPHQATTHLR